MVSLKKYYHLRRDLVAAGFKRLGMEAIAAIDAREVTLTSQGLREFQQMKMTMRQYIGTRAA